MSRRGRRAASGGTVAITGSRPLNEQSLRTIPATPSASLGELAMKKPSMAFSHETASQKAKVFQGSQPPYPAADEFIHGLLARSKPL
jgi:hypothetical protein